MWNMIFSRKRQTLPERSKAEFEQVIKWGKDNFCKCQEQDFLYEGIHQIKKRYVSRPYLNSHFPAQKCYFPALKWNLFPVVREVTILKTKYVWECGYLSTIIEKLFLTPLLSYPVFQCSSKVVSRASIIYEMLHY